VAVPTYSIRVEVSYYFESAVGHNKQPPIIFIIHGKLHAFVLKYINIPISNILSSVVVKLSVFRELNMDEGKDITRFSLNVGNSQACG
jgi:molybdopterin-binding protein